MKNNVIKLDTVKSSDTLTMEQALGYQARDLSIWKSVLQPKVYKALHDSVLNSNDEVTNPYDIVRGQSIAEVVQHVAELWSEIQKNKKRAPRNQLN